MKTRDYSKLFLEAAAVFAIAGAFFGWLVFSKQKVDTDDGFYHMAIAEMAVRQGPWVDIPWLPYTVLGESGPDHHFLWHLMIAPFTAIGDRFAGLQWAIVVTAALVPAVLTVIARLLNVPFAPLFALLAVVGGTFMSFRLLLLRAQNAAICFLAVALLLMTRRRNFALGIVAFLFMQAYHGAVILGPAVVLYVVIRRVRAGELELRPLAAVVLGSLLGLAISPWFPKNVEYLLFHTLYKMGNAIPVNVGTEWAHRTVPEILEEAWPVHLALIVSGLCFLNERRKANPAAVLSDETVLWVSVTLVFLGMFKYAWRFAEYYVPLGCLSSGLLLRDAAMQAKRLRIQRRLAPVAFCFLLFYQGIQVPDIYWYHSEFGPDTYRPIAEYLEKNAAPGSVIYNSNWADFVYLIWHTRSFRYANGLDIHYLAYGDPDRFNVWLKSKFAAADQSEDPAVEIRSAFGTEWALVDRADVGLMLRLRSSPEAELVLSTNGRMLFRLRPAPPPGQSRPRSARSSSSSP